MRWREIFQLKPRRRSNTHGPTRKLKKTYIENMKPKQIQPPNPKTKTGFVFNMTPTLMNPQKFSSVKKKMGRIRLGEVDGKKKSETGRMGIPGLVSS